MNSRSEKINRGLTLFLVDKRYLWARHVLLFLVYCIVAVGNVNYVSGDEYRWMLPLSFLLMLPVYLNVLFFTPRFLLNNRIVPFILSSVLTVMLCAVIAGTCQIVFGKKVPDWGMGFINSSSSVVSLVLLVAGTSVVMLLQRKIRDTRQIAELENATIRSELEQLKNQINPHFLFNMLNNANVLVGENPEEAERVLYKLRDLLAYQFGEGGKEHVLLSDEIGFLGDFLQLESIRRDKFIYTVLDMDCPPGIEVPPLLFIPFVENAVKHGNESRAESYVLLSFRVVGEHLDFMCTNSRPRFINRENKPGGLGLNNIRRRLELLYPDRHSLTIHETETTYNVHLHINL